MEFDSVGSSLRHEFLSTSQLNIILESVHAPSHDVMSAYQRIFILFAILYVLHACIILPISITFSQQIGLVHCFLDYSVSFHLVCSLVSVVLPILKALLLQIEFVDGVELLQSFFERFVLAGDVGEVAEDSICEDCLTSLSISLGNIVLHVSV